MTSPISGAGTQLGSAPSVTTASSTGLGGTVASRAAGAAPPVAAVNPDFGPAALFTPSQQLRNLRSSQEAELLGETVAGQETGLSAGTFTPTAFGQAAQYNLYNSAGLAVPLARVASTGALATGAVAADPPADPPAETPSDPPAGTPGDPVAS